MRRSNPLMPGPPAQHVSGAMGTPSTWAYRGRRITTHAPGTMRGVDSWLTEWTEVHPGGETEGKTAFAGDEQGALANARFTIDVYEKAKIYPGYARAELLVEHTVDWVVENTDIRVDRANVARQLFLISALIRKNGSFEGLPMRATDVDAFDALPLFERTRLIDEVIELYRRKGLIPPSRYNNPRLRHLRSRLL